jgi:Flp pilus assembly protein TadD
VISTLRRLQYAAGFLELGMAKDAARELRAITRADRSTPEVLSSWIDLHMQIRDWKRVITTSHKLTLSEPGDDKGWISWAFALRELNQIGEARAVLIRALPLHGETCDVLHYNLACYECLLGNLPAAKRYLKTATRKDKQWKASALEDSDLKALWPEIARLES